MGIIFFHINLVFVVNNCFTSYFANSLPDFSKDCINTNSPAIVQDLQISVNQCHLLIEPNDLLNAARVQDFKFVKLALANVKD